MLVFLSLFGQLDNDQRKTAAEKTVGPGTVIFLPDAVSPDQDTPLEFINLFHDVLSL